jgi:hypothetical protein
MYADLTENYVNFKAYISDSEFAASLQPNQKVDMYCFNATLVQQLNVLIIRVQFGKKHQKPIYQR